MKLQAPNFGAWLTLQNGAESFQCDRQTRYNGAVRAPQFSSSVLKK